MSKPKIYIGTPAYDGMVGVGYHGSVVRTVGYFFRRKIESKFYLTSGGSVSYARNLLTALFMADVGRYTHLLLLDADLDWEPEDVGKLIDADRDFVIGIYPKRNGDPNIPSILGTDAEGKVVRDSAGFVEVLRAQAGFMLIKRVVFSKMMHAYPSLKCILEDAQPARVQQASYALWDFGVSEGRYLHEDYTFCDRWRAIGGEIWAIPDIMLGHTGSKTYRASLAEAL